MDKILLSIIILVSLIVSGCVGSVPRIQSQVGVFHNITEQHKGKKVVVLPFQKELESSLEFQNYRKIIETKPTMMIIQSFFQVNKNRSFGFILSIKCSSEII